MSLLSAPTFRSLDICKEYDVVLLIFGQLYWFTFRLPSTELLCCLSLLQVTHSMLWESEKASRYARFSCSILSGRAFLVLVCFIAVRILLWIHRIWTSSTGPINSVCVLQDLTDQASVTIGQKRFCLPFDPTAFFLFQHPLACNLLSTHTSWEQTTLEGTILQHCKS